MCNIYTQWVDGLMEQDTASVLHYSTSVNPAETHSPNPPQSDMSACLSQVILPSASMSRNTLRHEADARRINRSQRLFCIIALQLSKYPPLIRSIPKSRLPRWEAKRLNFRVKASKKLRLKRGQTHEEACDKLSGSLLAFENAVPLIIKLGVCIKEK